MKVTIKDTVSNFDINRLGNLFPSNLSFSRRLVQKAAEEKWQFKAPKAHLNADGFGRYVVEVVTPNETFSFIAFSQYIEPEERTDRVIATAWDAVFALCYGTVTDEFCDELQTNLTKQEAGRYSSKVLSISRANKSVRMFSKVIDALVNGKQPNIDDITKIGYLYRTTAVYGNGKFGMADFNFLLENTSLDFPFAAQMLVVYLVREFSYFQANYIAKSKNNKAVALSDNSQRNLGIGNSTGLGMVPYLIRHSKPVAYWIAARNNALLDVLQKEDISKSSKKEFSNGLELGVHFFEQTFTDDALQIKKNLQTIKELQALKEKLNATSDLSSWESIFDIMQSMNVNYQTHEIVISLILELYPKICDSFFTNMNQDEDFQLIPQMSLDHLKTLIKSHYSWVDQYDFSKPDVDYYFWYSSENKVEPRLGVRTEDEGIEKHMPLGIAKQISHCSQTIEKGIKNNIQNVAELLSKHPEMRSIVKRIQNMGQDESISDIHINTLGRDILPVDLLICKLALLGASKYNPNSDRWVKVTFFQGAPLSKELNEMKPGIEHLFPIIK